MTLRTDHQTPNVEVRWRTTNASIYILTDSVVRWPEWRRPIQSTPRFEPRVGGCHLRGESHRHRDYSCARTRGSTDSSDGSGNAASSDTHRQQGPSKVLPSSENFQEEKHVVGWERRGRSISDSSKFSDKPGFFLPFHQRCPSIGYGLQRDQSQEARRLSQQCNIGERFGECNVETSAGLQVSNSPTNRFQHRCSSETTAENHYPVDRGSPPTITAARTSTGFSSFKTTVR